MEFEKALLTHILPIARLGFSMSQLQGVSECIFIYQVVCYGQTSGLTVRRDTARWSECDFCIFVTISRQKGARSRNGLYTTFERP